MEFYKHIYVGTDALEEKKKILYKLKHKKRCKDVHVIAIASNPENLLDIYSANSLLQPSFAKADIKVIGIAANKDEALELSAKIIQDMYTETKAFKIKEYLGFGL